MKKVTFGSLEVGDVFYGVVTHIKYTKTEYAYSKERGHCNCYGEDGRPNCFHDSSPVEIEEQKSSGSPSSTSNYQTSVYSIDRRELWSAVLEASSTKEAAEKCLTEFFKMFPLVQGFVLNVEKI